MNNQRFSIIRNTKVPCLYDVIEVDPIYQRVNYVERELQFEQAVGVLEAHAEDEEGVIHG